MRRWWLVCLMLLWASPAIAQTEDYKTDSGDWSGMQDFLTLARGEDVTVELHQTLDYSSMSTQEPLLILFPKKALKVNSLAKYVVDGGRLILADDFGESDEFLTRLDLSRVQPMRGTLPHQEYVSGNPALPIFRPKGVHPLLDGVKVVVANHPSVLFNVGGPVVPYSEDGGLVYDMNLGQGKVIAVADPSLWINHMLLVGDNERLLGNMLRYVCQDQSPCKVHLYVGDFEGQGSYGVSEQDNFLGLSKTLVEDVDAFNDTLRSWMDNLPATQLFYYLGILLAAGLVLYLYTIFPMRRTRPYSAYLTDVYRTLHPPQSEFDWNLSRFVQGNASMNYALPVSILKEIFEELFLRELSLFDLEEGEKRPNVQEIGARFAEAYLDAHSTEDRSKLKAQVIELLAQYTLVPTRHRVFLDSDTYYSERDLLKIHEQSLKILELMGRQEEYERRTRSHI